MIARNEIVALLVLAGTCVASCAVADDRVAFATASANQEDPGAAGKAAAEAAKTALGAVPLKAVLVSESYEDRDRKEAVLQGVCSVFDKKLVFGLATYGSFTQAGVAAGESVTVLAIGGEDISVEAFCQKDLGASKLTMADHAAEITAKLTAAGESLGKQATAKPTKLLVVLADAHSPKNGFLVQGLQKALGPQFPITGGCANKNAGQTFVYYRGEVLTDAAVALAISGKFEIAMAGRQAKDNDQVIATASQAAEEAVKKLGQKPFAVLAFDCAGRKGKLKNVGDELAAIQKPLGTTPLFGTYNAGEIGPADVSEATPGVLSSGVGWHVMVTAFGNSR